MLAAIVVGVVLFAFLFPRFIRRAENEEVERRLLRVCKGDTSQAERLIKHELERRPGLSRGQAAARAVDALARDNG
jgi:hypothetical protein